jgi:hypothetical protein
VEERSQVWIQQRVGLLQHFEVWNYQHPLCDVRWKIVDVQEQMPQSARQSPRIEQF